MAAGLLVLLSACSGNYSGPGDGTSGNGNGSTTGDTTTAASCEQLFAQRVQPRLDFCRSCHVPGGVADVPDGKLYQLSSDKTQDYAKLRASWEALGRNDSGKSRILKMASGTDTRSHTGGTPWPVGSEPYKNMDALLKGFVDPQACVLGAGGSVTLDQPLLGSKHGGHAWFDFCDGDGTAANPAKSGDALLPPDPRSLVQPGVNAGKAVYFNAFWKDCHVDPKLVNERPHPKTCGELRARRAAGAILMEGNGVLGQGSVFAGNEPNGYYASPAETFNNLWQQWGLLARPDNFIELLAERYGLAPTAARNPYPLPGEDPNDPAHPGGTGQLPYAFLQTRNHDGTWSGNISFNCNACHSVNIDAPGLGLLYGAGGSLTDLGTLARDGAAAGNKGLGSLAVSGIAGRTRGTNNAQFGNSPFVLVFIGTNYRPSANTIDFLTSGTAGTNDTIEWWNSGHRPVHFRDGILPADAVRGDLALFLPALDKQPVPSTLDQGVAWVEAHDQDADAWISSLRSPAWPYGFCSSTDGAPGPDDNPACINRPLAEQGAILFHSKNLWEPNLKNPVPKPAGGNGSCASCHGAYSPRYVNNPAYLDTPALEGIASYMVTKDLIGTDPERTDAYASEGLQDTAGQIFAGYPETQGADDGQPDTNPVQDCGPQNRKAIRGDRPIGYLAPPLYGVWASVPLFHNGSVPDVWGVLKPSDRPAIWRRVSKPARPDQQGKVVMGYDTKFDRAYDTARLGWKYDALTCGVTGTTPYLDCDPADPQTDPAVQQLLSLLYSNTIAVWNSTTPPVLSNQDVENRKIYNTHMFSQGNGGHEFTSVLTDQERRALIEYLKTL